MLSTHDPMAILEKFKENKKSLDADDITNFISFLENLTKHGHKKADAQKSFDKLEELRKAGFLEIIWVYGPQEQALSAQYITTIIHFMQLRSRKMKPKTPEEIALAPTELKLKPYQIIKRRALEKYLDYNPEGKKGSLLTRLDAFSCVRILKYMLRRYRRLTEHLKEFHPEYNINQINDFIKKFYPDFQISTINYLLQSNNEMRQALASKVAQANEQVNIDFLNIVDAVYPFHFHSTVEENLIYIFAIASETNYFDILAKPDPATLMPILHKLFNTTVMDLLSNVSHWQLKKKWLEPFLRHKHAYADYIITLYTEENKDAFKEVYNKIFNSPQTFLHKFFYAERNWLSFNAPSENKGALGKIKKHYEKLFPVALANNNASPSLRGAARVDIAS